MRETGCELKTGYSYHHYHYSQWSLLCTVCKITHGAVNVLLMFNCLSLVDIEVSATGWWEIRWSLPIWWECFFMSFQCCPLNLTSALNTQRLPSPHSSVQCLGMGIMLIGEQFANSRLTNIIKFNPVYMRDKSEEGSCIIKLDGILARFQSIAPLWWSPHLHHEHKMLTSDCQTNKKHIYGV